MSRESLEWLNRNVLIGFTDQRGTAWHYRKSAQGGEPNHYPGPIPVADVRRRLFGWRPVTATIEAAYRRGSIVRRTLDPDRVAIVRPDTGAIVGVVSKTWKIHEYNRWLLSNIENILDDDLAVASAGLLQGGGLAWVQVEMPETCTTDEGVAFRPFLSAATALNTSISTTYQTGAQLIVCDNTLSTALADRHARRIKIRHTSGSLKRITSVRQALGVIHQATDEFATSVARLCDVEVSDAAWRRFLDAHTPVPSQQGRSRTLAETKRETLTRLWRADERVRPWSGTAWGVVQAVNTYIHHEQTVRGAHRAERNMLRVVKGQVDALDLGTLALLDQTLFATAA